MNDQYVVGTQQSLLLCWNYRMKKTPVYLGIDLVQFVERTKGEQTPPPKKQKQKKKKKKGNKEERKTTDRVKE